MEKTNDKPLKKAIEEFLARYRLGDKVKEVKISHSWEKLVGKMIAKHTVKISIKNKVIYIELDSAALREELSYAKEKILKKLNTEIEEDYIEKIVFK